MAGQNGSSSTVTLDELARRVTELEIENLELRAIYEGLELRQALFLAACKALSQDSELPPKLRCVLAMLANELTVDIRE